MPTRTNAVRSRGSHVDALTDRHPNHQTARRLTIAAGLCVAGLMCTPNEAMAQGQLVYSQLGPLNTTGNPQLDPTFPSGAPSIANDGVVAYRRGTSGYTAIGNTIAQRINGNLLPNAPGYLTIDQSFRSPLLTSGVFYLASRELNGPHIHRSFNGVAENILRANQIIDTPSGTTVSPLSFSLGLSAAQGTDLVASVMTRTPNDPTSLYRPSLVRFDGTQPTLIASLGSTVAPGTSQTFAVNSSVTALAPALDVNGRVVFAANLTASTPSGFRGGIWTHTPANGLSPLYLARANSSDPVPTGPLSVNAQGDIAFISTDNNAYVYSASTGNVQPISARSPFQPAPSSTIALNQVVLNNAGQVLSSVSLSSSPTGRAQAMVITDPTSGPRVIARSGDPLPGFTGLFLTLAFASQDPAQTSQLFSPRVASNSVALFSEIAFNNLGQAVFLGGGGTGSVNDANALFAYDPRGGLITLALAGRPLPTTLPGLSSTATVTRINFIGNTNTTSGYATGLNDQGVVAFRASFSDGSSRLITVQLPTPGALTTLAFASLFAARRRRGFSN